MINLLYQTWINNAPISNSVPPHKRKQNPNGYGNVKSYYLEKMLEVVGIEWKSLTVDNFDPKEITYYHIQPEWIDLAFFYENVFHNIDDKVLNLLRDPKNNVRLLIWFPSEGFHLSMPRFLDDITWSINDKGIPFEKVTMVYGDLKIEHNYEKYMFYKRMGNDQKIKMYPFNVFETNYKHECDVRYFMKHKRKGVDYEKELIDSKELDRNHIRSHKFLCKNANPREHRIFIMSELYRKGYEDQMIHSFLNRYFTPDSIGNLKSYITESKQHYFDDIDAYSKEWLKTKTPIILDYDANNIGDDMNQRMLVKEHFTETYFSFVTETVFESNPGAPLFITEKTYMPFVNFHPFIITSGPGCLKYLQEQGYQTFPELFDESYDSITDRAKRLSIIMNNVERWCTKDIKELHTAYWSVWDKLEHNRKHFFARQHKSEWVKLVNFLNDK